MTESSYASGSTATPPKLLHTSLEIGESDDAFGSMFENFGKRRSQTTFDQGALGAFRTQSPVSFHSFLSIVTTLIFAGENFSGRLRSWQSVNNDTSTTEH